MVNNNFFKALLLSSAMVGFMLNTQAYAMMEENPNDLNNPNNSTIIIKQQDKSYAKSLFTDSVLKNKEFIDLKNTYVNLDIEVDSKEVSGLEESMRGIYKNYCSQCKKDNVEPYIPTGVLSFLAQPKIEMVYTDYESEIQNLELKYRDNDNPHPLFPTFNCRKAQKVIEEILLPTYFGYSTQGFGDRKITEKDDKIGSFLINNSGKVEKLANPDHFIIALKFMLLLNKELYPYVSVDEWECSQVLNGYPLSDQKKMKKSTMTINLENPYPHLDSIDFFNNQVNAIPGDRETRQKTYRKQVRENLYKGINETLFTVGGRPVFDISKDALRIGETLSDWFNITKKLVKLEKDKWKEKAPKIKSLMEQYNWVIDQLEKKDDSYYSSVNITPYSISLSQTFNPEKAEKRDDLRKIAETHYSSHEKDIDSYEQVKPYLSTLKKMYKWLIKAGKIS